MQNIIINIIIPCYYESSRVKTCLNSLLNQTARDQIQIYLVNDCSPYTKCKYQDILEEFSLLNIIYCETEINSGPGCARQKGLNSINNNAKYVMFLDDDDELNNSYVIENYIKIIQNVENKNNIVGFITSLRQSINEDNQISIEEGSFTGSIFNFNLIQLFNIKFNDWYYEEDTVFYIKYCTKINEMSKLFKSSICIESVFCDDFIGYNYNNNHNSLMHRSNNELYNRAYSCLKINNELIQFYSDLYPLNNKLLQQEINYLYAWTAYFTEWLIENNFHLINQDLIINTNNNLLQLIKQCNLNLDIKLIKDILYNSNLSYPEKQYINFNINDYIAFLGQNYSQFYNNFLINKGDK